jgi:hypothetical protein
MQFPAEGGEGLGVSTASRGQNGDAHVIPRAGP